MNKNVAPAVVIDTIYLDEVFKNYCRHCVYLSQYTFTIIFEIRSYHDRNGVPQP